MPGPIPIAVAVLTVAVLVLRLSQIRQSLYGDEVWTYQDIAGHSLGSVIRNVHTGAENSPPLFFVLAWLSSKLGDPTVWIRLPSLLLGTATIPLIYLLGRDTLGPGAGLVGAAIVGASPFSIYYGIEARPYATMAFFVTVSTLALIKAVDSRSARWWVLYTLAAAGAAYSHYTSIFVLGTQAAWSLWACRDRLRAPLLAGGSAVALYLPWLSHVRGKSLNVIGALQPLNAHNVLTDLGRVIPGYPYASLRQIPTIAGLVAIALCVALGAMSVARSGTRPTNWGQRHPYLMVALALATPVGLLLYSILATDLWLARGLYASVPAQALVLGAILVAPRPPIRTAIVAVVLGTLLAATLVRATSASYARPPFRTVAQYLDRVARPQDPIIMYAPFLDIAIPTQFDRAHLITSPSPAAWQRARTAGVGYFVFEDRVAQLSRLSIPHPAGLTLTDRRRYIGLDPFTLLTYRVR